MLLYVFQLPIKAFQLHAFLYAFPFPDVMTIFICAKTLQQDVILVSDQLRLAYLFAAILANCVGMTQWFIALATRFTDWLTLIVNLLVNLA